MTAGYGDGYFRIPEKPERSFYCPREWRADDQIWWRAHRQFLPGKINLLPAMGRERRIEVQRVDFGLVEYGVEGGLSVADEKDLGAHGYKAKGPGPFCHRLHFGRNVDEAQPYLITNA